MLTGQPAGHDTDGRTALVLVDVINDFFDSSGPNYYPWVEDTVAPMTDLLAAARAGGALVVHAVERHRRGAADHEQPKLPLHCLEGSLEADFFPGFEPADEEILVAKRRYSAFFATDLALLLGEHGVDRVVVAGVKTNVCIRATIQDAFAHGFEPWLPREATNSNRPHLAEAALEDVSRYFGTVCAVVEAQALLGQDQS